MHGQDANILHRQDLGLGGVLSGVVGGVNTAVSQVGSAVTSGVGGVVSGAGAALSQIGGGLTSGIGDITSALSTPTLTSSSSSTAPTSTSQSTSSQPTSTSSSSSRSTSTSISSTSSSSVVPSSTSQSSVSSTSITPTFSSASVAVTSNGPVTAFVTASSEAPAATSDSANQHKSFLQNKPLEGFVFSLVGIVGLVIIFTIGTFTLRRSRRRKLLNEAMSFEPTGHSSYGDDMERRLTEKGRSSVSSAGSSGSGPPFAAYGGIAPVDGGYPDQARVRGPGQQDLMGYDRVEYPYYAQRTANPTFDAGQLYYEPRIPASTYDVNQTYAVNGAPYLNTFGAAPAMPSSMPYSNPSPPPAAARAPTPPAVAPA